jgi:hypothetical protein
MVGEIPWIEDSPDTDRSAGKLGCFASRGPRQYPISPALTVTATERACSRTASESARFPEVGRGAVASLIGKYQAIRSHDRQGADRFVVALADEGEVDSARRS